MLQTEGLRGLTSAIPGPELVEGHNQSKEVLIQVSTMKMCIDLLLMHSFLYKKVNDVQYV